MQKFYILLGLLMAAVRYRTAQESPAQHVEAEAVVITPSGWHAGLKKLPVSKLIVFGPRMETSKIR